MCGVSYKDWRIRRSTSEARRFGVVLPPKIRPAGDADGGSVAGWQHLTEVASTGRSQSSADVLRILIVHYNTPTITSGLVRELPRKSPNGRHVVVHVLDNGSSPENRDALRSAVDGLSGVTLDLCDVNLGFGEGMNVLARIYAVNGSDIIWLLNSDTRIDADCIGRLESQLDSGDLEVVSPLIYSGHGSDSWIWYCGGTFNSKEFRACHDLYGFRVADAPTDAFETEFITGTAPMMHASTFQAVGGFPTKYFLYWEDTYLAWSARKKGFRLGVVPSAHLWHQVGGSSGVGKSSTYYYWTAHNRFVFAGDTGVPLRQLLVGRGGLETLRPIAKALLTERRDRFPKTRAAIRGTFRGFSEARTSSQR